MQTRYWQVSSHWPLVYYFFSPLHKIIFPGCPCAVVYFHFLRYSNWTIPNKPLFPIFRWMFGNQRDIQFYDGRDKKMTCHTIMDYSNTRRSFLFEVIRVVNYLYFEYLIKYKKKKLKLSSNLNLNYSLNWSQKLRWHWIEYFWNSTQFGIKLNISKSGLKSVQNSCSLL